MADNYQMVMELIDEVTPGIDAMKDKLTELLNAAGPVGKGMAASLGVVGAAATAAVVAMELISNAAKEGVYQLAELGDQANRLGMSVQDFQVFVNTMGQLGVKSDRAVDAMTDLQERVGEARQGSGEMLAVLNQLNIPLQNANGQWRSSASIISELNNKLVNMEDSSNRIRLSAQAGGDAYRDLIGNIAQSPELYARASENARNNVLITEDLVKAAKETRLELESYNQMMQASTLVNEAAMVPLMNSWQNVKTEIGFAIQGALQFFNILSDPTPAQEMAKVAQQLKIAKDDLANATGEDGTHKGLFAGRFNTAKKNVDELQAKLDKLKASFDAANPKKEETTSAPSQSDAQQKAQKKALDAAEAARKTAQAKSLSDFAAQAKAENDITNEKLKADAEETIKTNFITGKAKDDLWKSVNDTIAANSIATANKIKDHQDKLDKTAADKAKSQSTAVQKVITGLEEQTQTIDAQTQTIQTNSREMEYQVLLEKQLGAAKAANGNKDVDATTQLKIQNQVKEIQLANERKKAAEDTKNFKETIDSIDQQTELAAALTQEQKNQVEIKQAIIAKEKEYQRALSDTEKQDLTTRLISKQKAEATGELAKQNAAQIEQIYANAAENIQGAFSDFFFDAMQGNLSDLAGSFKKTIDRMVAELLASQLFKLVGGIGDGTAKGGGLSGMFASLFSFSGRAKGGPVTAGTPYWVGEKGPEIVVPGVSSTVIPADESASLANSSSSNSAANTPTSHYSISIQALDSKSFMDMIERDDRTIVTKLAEASSRYNLRG